MNIRLGLGLAAVLGLAACSPGRTPPAALDWAYPKAAKIEFPAPPGSGPYHVAGSALSFTKAQMQSDDPVADWFPERHPPPPHSVNRQGKGEPLPCAECHLHSGQGFLGAADLNGLPAAYIVAQVKAFRVGDRSSSEPGRQATHEMAEVANGVSDKRLAEAAAYYAALPRTPRLKVVEANLVPRTRPNYYGWRDLLPGATREPIAGRIIEVSDDFAAAAIRDERIPITAYVPPGAVKRGEALVASGGGSGQACRTCHGPSLRGVGEIPPLAGRSPSYLARALWDIRSGSRHDPGAGPMQAPARGLSAAQITDVTAYLASLAP